MKSKILVVDPSINIFEVLIDDLLKQGLEDSLVIFPHRRAVYFLGYYLFQRLKTPFPMPRAKAISDWLLEHYISSVKEPKRVLSKWDQIWLIYKSLERVYREEKEKLPSWEEMVPWCFYISKLFEEFEKELIPVKDLIYPPSEKLCIEAQKILERQGKIYTAYLEELEKHNAITPSQILKQIGEEDFPLPKEKNIYLVGFYALTLAEKILFERLLKKGAKLYLQSPSDELYPLHKELIERYKPYCEVVFISSSHKEPNFFFFSAYDVHSQLKAFDSVFKKLKISKQPDKIAIVLPNSSDLLPLLHFLPETSVNITMGYPFQLTSFCYFLNTFFDLVLFYKSYGSFSRDLLYELFKNPYLESFSFLSQKIFYLNVKKLSIEKLKQIAENEWELAEKFFTEVFFPFLKIETLKEAVEVLERLLLFLKQRKNMALFEKAILEGFLENVLFPAKRTMFSEERLGVKGVILYFKECFKYWKIPFEGDPLEGIQVMGLLETRLLSFEKVFILSANEDVLPPVEEINPLLPQEVRKILNLPDREKEEEIVRYHFERLIKSAKEVYIFWQYSTTPSEGEIERKKIRSRFVEKIIWEIEKKFKKLFEDTPYKSALTQVDFPKELTIKTITEYLEKTPKIQEKIKNLLTTQVISPSFLQEYLRCPLKFYYSKVISLKQPRLEEEIPLNELGETVHTALENYFRALTYLNNFDWEGKVIKREQINFEDFWQIFTRELKGRKFYKNLSLEKRILLEKVARFRLEKYLKENFPSEIKICALETSFYEFLDMPEIGKVKFFGKIDRIDKIENSGSSGFSDAYYLIIDYKTGGGISKTKKFLQLRTSQLNEEYNEKSLKMIQKHFSNLQLLFYIYLVGKQLKKFLGKEKFRWHLVRAGFIELSKEGKLKEISLKKSEYSIYHDWFENHFEPCIKFLINHILYAPYFYPSEDYRTCNYCEYKSICKHGF